MVEIPKVKLSKIDEYKMDTQSDERFVSISKSGLLVSPQYLKYGSHSDCYARETVVSMLKTADSVAQGIFGCRLLVLDAYRPIKVQANLWNKYYYELKSKYHYLVEAELIQRVSQFVSKPSEDVLCPSVHNTGGAVDVTLVDSDGKWLNMGTEFDDFSPKSYSAYFETDDADYIVRENRRILYTLMTMVGFTNLPSEWWHYDFGDAFWAHYGEWSNKDTKPFYAGISDCDFEKMYLEGKDED